MFIKRKLTSADFAVLSRKPLVEAGLLQLMLRGAGNDQTTNFQTYMKWRKFVLFKIIIFHFFFILIAYAQDSTWMKYGKTEALRAMNLEYRHPEGYTGSNETECFNGYYDFGCFYNKLESEDGHLIAFLTFETHSLAKDSVFYKSFGSGFSDMFHF